MRTFTTATLLVLTLTSFATTQEGKREATKPGHITVSLGGTVIDLAKAKADWQRHLEDNEHKIKQGETGKLTVTIKRRKGAKLPPRLSVRVCERVPDHARPGPFLQVTRYFVAMGTAKGGKFEVDGIPTGLILDVEVWHADESAPRTTSALAGPSKRGAHVEIETSPAVRFPVLTGRLLDAAGNAVCEQDVALELRSKTLPYQLDVRTDREGRFATPVRLSPANRPKSKVPGAAVTITAKIGKLVVKGSYRFWTTEMPAGPSAEIETEWPTAVRTDVGDLRIRK